MHDFSEILTHEFAQEIAEIIFEETGFATILVNKEGKIFAASEKGRIGSFHSVAKKIMDGELKEGVVTLEDAKKMTGVKAGINRPIIYKGKKVAVLGISGNPEVIRSILQITVRTTIGWMQNKEILNHLTSSVQEISNHLQEITSTVQEITSSAQQVASANQMTFKLVEQNNENIRNIDGILQAIQYIASQSNLIGLNAAIEAARVGDAGRAFSVVANEIRKLSRSSNESVDHIKNSLEQIRSFSTSITQNIAENKAVTEKQSDSLFSITNEMVSIEKTVANLIYFVDKDV